MAADNKRTENQGATTPKRVRPVFSRSQTASPEVSPQQHQSHSVTAQAAKKLHLHSRHESKDQNGRDERRRHHHRHLHHGNSSRQSTGRAIVEIAKAKVPGMSAENSHVDLTEGQANKRAVQPADVEREQRLQGLRNEELGASLDSLTELASTATGQLDRIYYAILEKASALRASVTNLQKLLMDSRELRHTFAQDTTELKDKIESQLAEFRGFEAQESAIERLEARIKKSTERAKAYNDRLEKARERVERWEKREAEWQARTSGRIRASIISLSCVLAVLFLLFFIRWLYINSHTLDREHLEDALASVTIPFGALRSARARADTLRPSPSEDPRLRLLDEL